MNKTTDQAPKYWKSLDRLLESPAVQQVLQDEFPEGASFAPDLLTRRSALKLMGASFALAGLVSCRRPEERIVPHVSAPENMIPGVPRYYATTQPFGSDACGLLVETHDGRPTKIEGNQLHPASAGSANGWMQASILGLYDPDRSTKPMTRGGGDLEPATWDRFFEFWQKLAPELESSKGAGLAVVSEAYTSPTLNALRAEFQARFPQATWVVWEPLGDANIFEGIRLAVGEPLRPVFEFGKAGRILSLDADSLLTEGQALHNARGFGKGRRSADETGDMNRLYVVESGLSVTGAAADHRLRLKSGRIPLLVLELAARLKAAGLPLNLPATSSEAALPKEASDWIAKVVEDFVQAPRDCFVVAGRGQPPEVHAAAYYINEALGAVGPLVSLVPLEDVAWENPADLADLVRRINEGTVQTLILLGGNPAFNAPADLEFGTAIGLVENSIHLSTHVDETSHLADWHLPRAHFLESWGDARAADGSVSAIQPVIAPLYGGRSMIEVVGSLTRNEEVAGHDLVREVWSESLVREDFETNWRKTLHDGILEDSHLNPAVVRTREDILETVLAEMGSRPIEKGLEVVFTPSNNVFDGRFSNVSWLQETPDPITKIVWGNAALISPATAEELGLVEGQIVRLGTEERRIEVPVHIQPGQTDNSIALSLGYGRTSAGNVGSGVGANGYGLRTLQQLYVATGLELNGTKGRHQLVLTQEHWNMEGRSIVREAALQEFRSRPDFAQAPDSDLVLKSLWEEPDYSTGSQWGMTIDLNSCIGCNACVVACQSENNIPVVGREQISKGREMQWLRVDRYFSGSSDSPEVVHQPVPCMHCENAPCEEVCPVAATVHDGEGLNLMVYNRCIGTRYCSNNCPYKVRRFNFFNYTKDTPETVQLAMNPDVTVRSRGVMEKCTYCVQRINEAGIRAKSESREVRDGEIQTACQQTCPTQAISFGNINDPNSAVSQQRANNRNYQLLAELNNQPRTSFLAKLRNRSDQEVES